MIRYVVRITREEDTSSADVAYFRFLTDSLISPFGGWEEAQLFQYEEAARNYADTINKARPKTIKGEATVIQIEIEEPEK
jgi:hypothetical protein